MEVGAASNVDANLINEIEGVAALAARVSNPEPLGGGGDKEVRAVDPADRTTATEDIRPKLREAALKDEHGVALDGAIRTVDSFLH